jgi:alkylhydroperoxidase family enzyme
MDDMADPSADAAAAPPPRIGPLQPEELTDDALALATQLRATFNLPTESIPEVVATMLRHPEFYRAQIDYIARRTRALTLPARLLELAILRTAWLCRSGYSWAEHVRMGKAAGLSVEDVARVTEGSAASGWAPLDRAVVRAVEELHDEAVVSDETCAALEAELSDKQLIELLTIIGAYHEIAFLYNSLRVRLLPGSAGLAAR